jgi:signal transduction histidine kinase
MKRRLKMISPRRNSVKQMVGSTERGFLPEEFHPKQGIAQIEKARSTIGALNELTRTISHYLNSPLTVLLGKVELLARMNDDGGVPSEEVEKFVQASRREIFRMDAIVKAFGDIYQVQHKTYPPGVKLLDVEKEIRNRTKDACFLR